MKFNPKLKDLFINEEGDEIEVVEISDGMIFYEINSGEGEGSIKKKCFLEELKITDIVPRSC